MPQILLGFSTFFFQQNNVTLILIMQNKAYSPVPPLVAPYVKVYLMEGKNCKEKQKTNIARRTLDPLYQQQLYFTQPYGGCILQVCFRLTYSRLISSPTLKVNFSECLKIMRNNSVDFPMRC